MSVASFSEPDFKDGSLRVFHKTIKISEQEMGW